MIGNGKGSLIATELTVAQTEDGIVMYLGREEAVAAVIADWAGNLP